MFERMLRGTAASAPSAGTRRPAEARPFRLIRHFTLTSLVAFGAVGIALLVLERREQAFFAQVQREQAAFFAKVQDDLARKQEESARTNLVAVHELGHVNLARLFANVLWASDFAPFVERAREISVDECRAIPDGKDAQAARRACHAAIGARMRALPGFAAIDAKALATMRNTTVFKIKVFDLRGITVYSSEHAQVGEDASGNQGWKSAASGIAASELTHRDRFSAFEGVVENRDLISSYLPVFEQGGERVLGVFEIYSDVTPLLLQIRRTASDLEGLTQTNLARVEQASTANQALVDASSNRLLLIVGALLAVLYVALLVLVRRGQGIIDRQALAQAQASRREAAWHREKMAALSTMAANVAHEVGNPLVTISAIAEDLRSRQQAGEDCSDCDARAILEAAQRISQMTREIADFASARSESAEPVDVNGMVKAMLDFLRFDQRFRTTRVEFSPGEALPACEVVPDHLNEVLMAVFEARLAGNPGPWSVATAVTQDTIEVTVGGPDATAPSTSAPGSDAARLDLAGRRLADMGGRLETRGAALVIVLPLRPVPAPAN